METPLSWLSHCTTTTWIWCSWAQDKKSSNVFVLSLLYTIWLWTTENADLQDYISTYLAVTSQLKIMKDDLKTVSGVFLKLIVTSATGRQVSTGPHEGRMTYDKLTKINQCWLFVQNNCMIIIPEILYLFTSKQNPSMYFFIAYSALSGYINNNNIIIRIVSLLICLFPTILVKDLERKKKGMLTTVVYHLLFACVGEQTLLFIL